MDTEQDDLERALRILPRVSKSRGGLAPHVDLVDQASLQEEDDFDYVQRMKLID